METLEIREQPKLSFARTLRLTVDAIRYRLFRSMVTVAVIAVAIAFLTNILTEALFKRSVVRSTRDRLGEMRLVHVWATRLSSPGTTEQILRELAHVEENDPFYAEFATMGRLSPQAMSNFYRGAKQVEAYLTFFEDLNYDKRRSLVHTAQGIQIFDQLKTKEGMNRLKKALRDMKSVRFVTTMEELSNFLRDWPELSEMAERVQQGRTAAIRKVQAALEGRSVMEALADAEGEPGDVIRAAGFAFNREVTAAKVAAQVRMLSDRRMITKSINGAAMRQAVASRKNILPNEVTSMMMWKLLRNEKTAEWHLGKMKENGLDVGDLDAERVVSLGETFQKERDLEVAERAASWAGQGWMGLGPRMGWLVVVSMIVCAVGICNAMLMAVTERFREIATLKCLGALDTFIMLAFVLESCFLGVVGGCAGAVVGTIIGVGRMLFVCGVRFLPDTPVMDLLVCMIVAVGIGVVLAAIASVYPSCKAARLAPMEAMRIE